MNRYPLWKYLIIVTAVLAGIVYTLPNFFGESPAIQVSPLRTGVKVDLQLLQKIDDLLSDEGIVAQGSYLDKNGVKVRFEDADSQLRAKDTIQSDLGKEYVVALNLLPNSPSWLTSLNALPMYLGLDLRGGVHFLLQVDMPSALQQARESYLQDLRQVMRSENIRYSKISTGKTSIDIEFRDESLRDNAIVTLEIKASDLTYSVEERSNIAVIVAQIKPEVEKRIQEFALQQNITTLRNRVNELGVAEPIVQQSGADRVVVQLPGVQDTAKAKDILGWNPKVKLKEMVTKMVVNDLRILRGK